MPKNRSTKTMSFDAIGRDLTPAEVRDAKAFAEKYSPGGKLLTRVGVHAEQRRVIEDVLHSATQTQPSERNEPKLPLLPLLAFQEAQAEPSWESRRPPAVLAVRESERFIVQLQEATAPLLQGPWRTEALAEQGVSACDVDAESFANSLVAAVSDRLSIYQLEYVVTAFSAELARQEAARQKAIAQQRKGRQAPAKKRP
jgi:hypothetical protein